MLIPELKTTKLEGKTLIATQRVFDEAWKHILKQGQPSFNLEEYTCVYRNKITKRKILGCAFFPAIKRYSDELEGRSAADLLEYSTGSLHDWARDCDTKAADDIQRAHDMPASDFDPEFPGEFIGQFKKNMTLVAHEYNLKIPKT